MPVAHVKHMKWWGWGEPGVSFTHRDKPRLAPFVADKVGLDLDRPGAPPPDLDALNVAPSVVDEKLRSALTEAVGTDHVHDDRYERVLHAYGKSLRDLLRLRAGDPGRVPDVVVYPGSEHEVTAVMDAASAAGAVVVAFGGGTNISGSLEPPRAETRTVVSVDLGRLDRVLSLDPASRLATVQAGVRGPALEAQLAERGWTMGHFPDSFTHSTLGGWIATRSSGMQSDRYGDISGITRALRVVTPAGLLVTRAVPATSTGPSVREMVLGSEGRLGIITEATVQVHRLAAERVILGYFFPTWPAGLAAMEEIAASETAPFLTRVSDPGETKFSLATAKAPTVVSRLQSVALKRYLGQVKHVDLDEACLSFIGFEGSAEHVRSERKAVGRIVASHGGVCVGTSPGKLYDQKKFDTPYIRDYLLERGGLADVSETATTWSNLGDLYDGVNAAARKTFAGLGTKGWIMCHLSHSYHSGACLYFTFAFKPSPGGGAALAQYDAVKTAVQQAFIDHGATLSHHHAVGVEHARWMAEDVSPVGVAMIRALFDGIDAEHRLNPGKIVP